MPSVPRNFLDFQRYIWPISGITDRPMTIFSCLHRPQACAARSGVATVFALWLLHSGLFAQTFDETVAGELSKREDALLDVSHYMEMGDRRLEANEIGRAFVNYRRAFETVPQGPAGDVFRDVARDRYAKTAVQFAELLMSQGRHKDAGTVIEEVLSDNYAPGYKAALVVQERLADPEWAAPGDTPKHRKEVSNVKRLLEEADQLLGMGEFDAATDKFSQVLNIDNTNEAARKGLSKAAKLQGPYLDSAYDQYRAKLLDDIAKKWEYNNPDVVGPSMRPKAAVDVGTLTDAPQSEDIASRLTSIIVPEVNFSNMTIEPAVQYLERVSRENDPSGQGINFVVDSSEGVDRARTITLAARSVPLLELVRYVTEFIGAKFRIDQYAVHIVPSDEQDTTMISRQYLVPPDFFTGGATTDDGAEDDIFGGDDAVQVQRVSPEDFLKQNGVSFDEGASAQYIPTANKLIVRNTFQNLEIVDGLVAATVAGGTKQVDIQLRVVSIQQENLEEISFDWLLGGFELHPNKDVLFGGGTLVPPLLEGENSDFTFFDPDTGEAFGGQRVTAGNRSGNSVIGIDGLDRVIGVDRETALATNLAPGMFSVHGRLTDPQFQAVLRGLSQATATDIVTAPRVTVKPGHMARIESGTEFIYPVEYDPPELPQEVGISSAGIFPVTPSHPTTFEMRPLGFNLQVDPVISADGRSVDLNLSPEFVEFIGFINYGSPITAAGTDIMGNPTNIVITDNQILMPVFSTIRAALSATVYDGATLVLGGLQESRIDTVADKVPIAGDLPFIGRLFRSNIERQRNRNVMIFVTVNVIDSQGRKVNRDAGQDTGEYGLAN